MVMSDKQLFSLLDERQDLLDRIAKLQAKADKMKGQVIEEMERRGTTALENDRFRVSYVVNSTVTYDEDALFKDLTPAQRREAFRDEVNLNALKPDTRRAVIESLPRAERRQATTRVLDVSSLSAAVQAGKVPFDVVDKHSAVKESAPYIRVSIRS